MKKRFPILAALILMTALSFSGCKKKETVDLTGIHTSEAETMASSETKEAETKPEETAAEETTAAASAADSLNVRSHIATYKDGKVSIEYPILSNLRDTDTEKKVNELIKETATKLVTAYELNPETDTVSVKCDVISLERTKAVLSFSGDLSTDGAAHPTSLFYTMTVDLSKGTLKGLSDFADPYTMAGYIVSDDCIITKSVDDTAAKEYLSSQDVNLIWDILKKSDFTSADDGTFPEAFSYVNQGTVYISVPVSHALGDYVIVEFHTENK